MTECSSNEMLINALGVPAFALDARGKVTAWNESLEEITGRSYEDMKGKVAWNGFYSKKRLTPAELVLRSEEVEVDEEFPVTHKSTGEDVVVKFTANPLMDEEGELVGAVAVLSCEGNGNSQVIEQYEQDQIAIADGVQDLVKAAVEGKLDTRADSSKFEGNYKRIADSVNELIDAFVAPINVTAEYVDRISKGDIPEPITDEYYGDFNEIKNNLNLLISVTQGILKETNGLVESAVAGQLDSRGNAEAFIGGWSELIGGVNKLVDAFVAPINVTAEYVDRISKGDIPEPITDTYYGDFNEIKNNLNACIDVMNGLLKETNGLVEAAVSGQLDSRGNAEAFIGGWSELIGGVNRLVDAFVAPINVTAEYVDRISKGDIPEPITDTYYGDFNEIKNNLNQCIKAVSLLVQDAGMIVQAALDGKLGTRADVNNHSGDYAHIVKGINDTLDAVVAPVTEAADVLKLVAEGDLTNRVKGNYKGDLAMIKDALNASCDGLHDAMAQVTEAVDQVGSASGQIASSSQAVAEGASEQASSLEETSSSLEEMESMTKQNADNAQEANTLALTTRDVAGKSRESMGQMVEAMDQIKASAEGTAQIIRDINDIAFQTNLLALNAAVEAARAGEAGRGFAVVAEEVRNLALRSKEAAAKTESLINESVKLSENGQGISKEVNEQLVQVIDSIGKVTDIVGEIAAASQEQSNGIEQVNKAVAQMDQVTQQNAANSEESSSAAEELSSQAQELAGMVGRFKLNRRSQVSNLRVSNVRQRTVNLKKGNGSSAVSSINSKDMIPMGDDSDFKDF